MRWRVDEALPNRAKDRRGVKFLGRYVHIKICRKSAFHSQAPFFFRFLQFSGGASWIALKGVKQVCQKRQWGGGQNSRKREALVLNVPKQCKHERENYFNWSKL